MRETAPANRPINILQTQIKNGDIQKTIKRTKSLSI